MSKLNIDFLINTPIEELVENINFFFNNLLQEIESYLNLEPVYTKINVNFKDRDSIDSQLHNKILFFGVERIYENKVLNILIYREYIQFIPIILLREAYKCFIPTLDTPMETIDIFINQKVSIDLKKLESIKEYNSIIRNKLIDYKFISREYDRLDNFLNRDSTGKLDSPFKFFFKYIRKNIKIINEKKDDFYDTIFKDYLLISSKTLYDDDIIETIRVLFKIFEKVQYYTALLDYQHYL